MLLGLKIWNWAIIYLVIKKIDFDVPSERATLDKGPRSKVQWNWAFLLIHFEYWSLELDPNPLNILIVRTMG
jgi:hypothetical protein